MKPTRIVILVNLLLVFGVMAYQINKKEGVLSDGELILMELRPVDPRSLMQGDYMTISYAETRINYDTLPPNRGYMIVRLDENRVAKRVRFQKNSDPLNEGEYRLRYFRSGTWDVNIGAESYFFQEGSAKRFEAAEYGGLRVLEDGHTLLANMYDSAFQIIEPE